MRIYPHVLRGRGRPAGGSREGRAVEAAQHRPVQGGPRGVRRARPRQLPPGGAVRLDAAAHGAQATGGRQLGAAGIHSIQTCSTGISSTRISSTRVAESKHVRARALNGDWFRPLQ
eukprot:1176717-Prorocentrum_minimum.AAC.1